MEEENKLPLKRVELSLTKFNEVAIPHHLDLLRQHKANILKYEESGEYTRVRAEQTNARRVASQLRVLLGELDCLRRQVRNEDLVRFDALTKRSRDNTLRAIVDYLGIIESSCRTLVATGSAPRRIAESPPRAAHSAASSESVGVLAADEHDAEPVQLQLDTRELQLRAREDALRGWGALQAEVRALHDAWQHVQAAALAHRQQVEATASHVEEAAENVVAARADLSMAEKLRAASYGAGGALCGALLGGPAGALLGAKAAACAALAGSALGYAGARLLGRRRREQIQKQQ
ncbi:uncharacterized protein LOC106137169 isoform X1 [Amyelois transitella]|uniref:uncharacterized protein LOC106137169 isoform X1 n=1 Tax=Amyelois transitella TaxID=680683 RepID=UPI00298FEC07|nr:uncharacterized protein LOC106137169 isoform X1 [Amyelois transitella]